MGESWEKEGFPPTFRTLAQLCFGAFGVRRHAAVAVGRYSSTAGLRGSKIVKHVNV